MRKDVAHPARVGLVWFGWQPVSSPMARGFEHGDGWFNIRWRLRADLEPLVMEIERETGERFEVLQVKAKLSTLRFSVSHYTDAIDGRIEEALVESSRTCEVCGQRGGCARQAGGFGPGATPTDKVPESHEEIHCHCAGEYPSEQSDEERAQGGLFFVVGGKPGGRKDDGMGMSHRRDGGWIDARTG